MRSEKILCIAALFFATVSFFFSMHVLTNKDLGPYFIDSNEALAADINMKLINQKIAIQDEILKKEEQAFNDSITKLLDTLSVRRGEEEKLIDLMNLESNVFRHKKIDSITKASQMEIEEALASFNNRAKIFCEQKKIPVLFGSSNNSIVYGSKKKADLTNDLIKFIGNEK